MIELFVLFCNVKVNYSIGHIINTFKNLESVYLLVKRQRHEFQQYQFQNPAIFEQIVASYPTKEVIFGDEIERINLTLFEIYIKLQSFDASDFCRLKEKEVLQHLEFCDYLKSDIYLNAVINKILQQIVKPQNSLEILMHCYKKLKGGENSLVKQQTSSYDIYYQFFTQLITYIAMNFDRNATQYIQEMRQLNEKIQDEIIDRYFKQKIQQSTTIPLLKGVIDTFLNIKVKSDHLELMKIRQKNLIHKNYNSKNHPNISWKLTNLRQITEKETAHFNFKQFNLQLYAKREDQLLQVYMKLISLKNQDNVINLPNGVLTFYYSVEINGIKQKSTFVIDHFVQGKKMMISLKSFNLMEMNKLDNQALASNTKTEFIVYLQYDVIYSSLMNYSCSAIDSVCQSRCLSALSPNDIKCLITSYLCQPLKYNESELHKQQIVQQLMQNWITSINSNNNISEEQLVELFKDLEINLDGFQSLQRIMNTKKLLQNSPLKKIIEDKIKTLSQNQNLSHYAKPRQNSEDLGNVSPKRNSFAQAPMSLRSSSNAFQLESDEIIKKYQNHSIQNRSDFGYMNSLVENTPQSSVQHDLQGAFSNQTNKSKTNRIQESIRQIASPKQIVNSSTTRNIDSGYLHSNGQTPSLNLSLKNSSITALGNNNNKIDQNNSGVHTNLKDYDIKQITQKYLNSINSKPPLSLQGNQSYLQTEVTQQNNYDLKKLLSPTVERSTNYSNNSSQIRFLSPGPVLETNTSKNQSYMNEYFNTEQNKRLQKNYVVQKREISLNDQNQNNKTQHRDSDNLSKTSDDGFKYRIKSPQPTDISKRDSDYIVRLDTSVHSENTNIPVPLISKLKSENDLDIIKQKSPKITPIANPKGGSNFAGSAVTSPLTKKFVPNFSSDTKGFDIQPYRLIDLNTQHESRRYDLVNDTQKSNDRDASLGVRDLKGFTINEIDSFKNLDLKSVSASNFNNIKLNSYVELSQNSEPVTLRRESSEQSNSQLKVFSTNQLFSKALQSNVHSSLQNQSNSNGFSNQRISTLQNLFSSSNLDNGAIGSTTSAVYGESALQPHQSSTLPSHLLQERTSRKIQMLNSIHLKSFALSDDLKLAFA